MLGRWAGGPGGISSGGPSRGGRSEGFWEAEGPPGDESGTSARGNGRQGWGKAPAWSSKESPKLLPRRGGCIQAVLQGGSGLRGRGGWATALPTPASPSSSENFYSNRTSSGHSSLHLSPPPLGPHACQTPPLSLLALPTGSPFGTSPTASVKPTLTDPTPPGPLVAVVRAPCPVLALT